MKSRISCRFLRSLRGLFLCLICLPVTVSAETYPARSIKVIVPYPAGGIVDVVARIVTEKMATDLGQPIVVENRPGANAEIGSAVVKKAAPDGYTLLVGSSSIVTNHLVNPNGKISYADFVPVGTLAVPPNLLVVPAASRARTLKEFIAIAKADPGKINATNPGIGSSNHLSTELFQSVAGVEFTQISYKGQPPFIPDLLNGQIDFSIASTGLVSAYVREGRLRALAVSYDKRLKNFPEIPTLAELGYPELAVLPWAGFFAPLNTPAPILEQLSAQLQKTLKDPEVIRRYEAMEAVNPELFRDSFTKFLREDEARWRKVVNDRHIQTAE
jgi:tripartite-type tricarboxylate transporter receptor subunit TctC